MELLYNVLGPCRLSFNSNNIIHLMLLYSGVSKYRQQKFGTDKIVQYNFFLIGCPLFEVKVYTEI